VSAIGQNQPAVIEIKGFKTIRARNRKLKQYTDVLAAFDEGGKARVRDRTKSNCIETET
jgi:hypothetical protein